MMAGVPDLAGTGDSFDVGSARTVMPAMTARQVRITRHFALGIFSLIIICNLSRAKSVRASMLADAVEGVADVLPRATSSTSMGPQEI
jgi:predicted short-subunit dehydrogenase-like oxidoreductase (DUF2520 family)